MLLRWLGTFSLCFLAIYLIVFLGGWKLFESGDPILIEIGAALVLSIFFFAINEVLTMHEKKIKDLEDHIKKLEDTQRARRKDAEPINRAISRDLLAHFVLSVIGGKK